MCLSCSEGKFNSMKISFVIGSITGGGAERVISVLANSFSSRGHDVSILAIIEDNVGYELDSNIKYYANQSKESKKLKRIKVRYNFLKKNIEKINPDIIVSFTTEINIYTLIANLRLNAKTIISERNDPQRDPPSKITRIIRNLVYNLSNGYVFQTEDAKEYFSKSIQSRSAVIPNPLKKNLPKRYDGERKKEFVTVARLAKQKNLKMLIDAFSLLCLEESGYILKIYGEGPLRADIERYILEKNLNDQVFLMGFEKDVHSKILDATAFILSSDYEGISNAMLEALAIGLPTISTDCPVGGARMFIKPRVNGLLVPVGDTEALYRGMREIVNNIEFAEMLSKNSIYIKNELSEQKICMLWEKEIKNITEMI